MKKFKRIAAVAAVAVAGPTALLSTPAMAADQPAVIVPDIAPKDDAAPGAGEAAETGKAPEATTPVVETPAPAPVAPVAPVAETPAPTAPAAPKAEQPSKVAETSEDELEVDSDGFLMGPEVLVAGIPKDGFKPDGSWTQLKVTVDNSGHPAVPNYTPSLTVFQQDDRFKPSQVKVEWRVGGQSWQSAPAVQAPELGPGLQYDLGTMPDVARNAVTTIDVRISFAANSPVVAFEMYTDGQSRTPNGTNHSPANWYNAKISGATDGPEDPFVEGPALTLSGLPETVKAGGDWANLTLHVDNSGKDAWDGFQVGMLLSRPDWVSMESSQITVEVLSKDQNGKAGWHEAGDRLDEGVFLGYELAGGPVAAGQSFDVQVRVRLSADAPLGDLRFTAWGSSQTGPDTPPPWAQSRSQSLLTEIVAATPETGGNTGNQPKPDGGTSTTPISDTGSGTGGTTNTGSTGSAGGELAATGADSATSWALGGAGVALSLGAALVAGTGRRRRTTA